MEFDRAQLKRSVKLSMKGTSPKPMLVALLFIVVVSAGTWLLNTVLGGLLTMGAAGNFSQLYLYFLQRGYEIEEAMEQAVLAFFSQGPGNIFSAVVGGGVLSILISLWQSTMNVGYEGYALSMVRNENPPLGKIFGALPLIGPVVLTRLLTGLFIFLWSLLVAVVYVALLAAGMVLAALADSVALVIPAVLIAIAVLVLGIIWVSVRYVLVDYVLLDKGLYGLDAIRESKRLMRGNIAKCYILQLSFFGWYLLMAAIIYGGIIMAVIPMVGAFASGGSGGWVAASGFALLVIAAVVVGAVVLSLWLKPYVTGSMAKFYDWACGAADGGHGGPAFSGGPDGSWGGPTDYKWSTGAGSGTGMGPISGNGGSTPPPPQPPKPKDDPWN